MQGIHDIGHSRSVGLAEQTVSSDDIIGGMKGMLFAVKAFWDPPQPKRRGTPADCAKTLSVEFP